MSWIRSTLNKAMEVKIKNKRNLSFIRNVADNIILHSEHVVASGTNLLWDDIRNRNAVKRLEEVSVSYRGEERVLLLRRWLVSFKKIEKMNISNLHEKSNSDKNDESYESSHPNLILYYDSDRGCEKLNFHDIFLRSQALEGTILSMILEAPCEEEVNLLLEIFRHSLMGGKEVHDAIMSSIQDLAQVFSSYHDEVLIKREELLQYAQIAITGLKKNVDLERIDLKVSTLKTKLNRRENKLQLSEDDGILSQVNGVSTLEALKDTLSKIQMYSKLKALLIEKKATHIGESEESHTQKVDKLKILLESLANSTLKAKRRIIDQRFQKEAALHFRLTKAIEVSQVEKELVAEVEVFEKQKDELEVELRKINISLSMAKTRLRNAREERDQFHDASNEIVQHLHMKEEELSRSIVSYKAEAYVVATWIKFMEDAWGVQSSFASQNEKQVNDELESYARHHVELLMRLLPTYKNKMQFSVTRFRVLVRRLKSNEESPNETELVDEESLIMSVIRKSLEEEYLDLEAKLTTMFSLLENIRCSCTSKEELYRNDDQSVKQFFDIFDKLKDEFEGIEKPPLRSEIPKRLLWQGNPLRIQPKETPKKQQSEEGGYSSKSSVIDGKHLLDSEEATPESVVANLNNGQEIIDWEFDALDN